MLYLRCHSGKQGCISRARGNKDKGRTMMCSSIGKDGCGRLETVECFVWNRGHKRRSTIGARADVPDARHSFLPSYHHGDYRRIVAVNQTFLISLQDVDPLQDTVPSRYAIESDEEDEFNPLQPRPSQDVSEFMNVKIVGSIPTAGKLIITSGDAGRIWARGAKLGEQTGAVYVNEISVRSPSIYVTSENNDT